MKKTKLFKNGQSQAVRLPKEFRFEGDEVFIQKVDSGILLTPVDDPWSLFKKGLEEFSEDYMSSRQQPKSQRRQNF